MKLNITKLAAGFLSAAILVTGMDITAYAVELDKVLPVAGFDLSLNEGISMKVVAEEKGLDTETECYIVEPAEIVKNEILEEMKEDYSNLVIADVNSYVNIRSIPSEDGEVVGKLYDNSVGNFLEEENGWYKIESGSCIGYVKAEFCVTGEEANELAKEVGRRTATVTTETLNVRKEPNTKATLICIQFPASSVTVRTSSQGT